MPRISAFYGIVITMYYDEHGLPHFHATYGGQRASIAIATGQVLAGRLPERAVRLVLEWSSLHQAELQANWARARREEPLEAIAPLP